MNQVFELISEHRRTVFRGGLITALVLVSVFLLIRPWAYASRGPFEEKPLSAKVDRVVSGHKVKLETEERITYAGIRAPYPQEPLFEESKRRNTELVQDKKVRLRFDKEKSDPKDLPQVYVFVDGKFVNETLVSEGLAYVRLTPSTRRFADRLLAAQTEAQKHKRGLWAKAGSEPLESKYLADPKYGNFHRPSCEESPKINPERLVTFNNPGQAYSQGFAPCVKCRP